MGPFLGTIVTIVFIIAGLVQALAPVFKAIAEANEKAKREALARSGGSRSGSRNDPDSFLPQLKQQGVPQQTSNATRPPDVRGSSDTAVAPRRQAARPKKKQNAAAAKPAPKSAPAAPPRGSGVGSHVDSYISQHVKSHIGQQIGDAVKNDISDQVRSHLGEDKNKPTAPGAATTHGSAAAGDLLSALRSPQGVRQAIMISEVLGRPKSLRRS